MLSAQLMICTAPQTCQPKQRSGTLYHCHLMGIVISYCIESNPLMKKNQGNSYIIGSLPHAYKCKEVIVVLSQCLSDFHRQRFSRKRFLEEMDSFIEDTIM
jgi:hypothetical protein